MTDEHDAARTLAARYVDRVNARQGDDLMALFHPAAVLRHPLGVFDGADAIRDFYETWVFAAAAEVTLGPMATSDGVLFFELTAVSANDPQRTVVETVDVVEVDDDGRITRLGVYSR